MTFRFANAFSVVSFVLLLSLAGTALASDEPLNLSATSSLSRLPQQADAADTPSETLATTPPAIAAPGEASAPPAAPLPSTDLAATELVAPHTLPGTIDLTASPDDLFERIRNGFAMPNLTGDLVLAQQQWYLNRPDYLRRMVDRSSRYLHFIVEEIERRGMPTELAFLPMVESAFNPVAYSRAHASGLWQFIPSTGKSYNLKQDWWIDQRRDVVAATSAALDYLQYIYDMHGDWFLALASYNWGEGAVGRAIRSNSVQ
jgi:membrane-bound lytic murein transglycosylase D